jgi:hypothetical protein
MLKKTRNQRILLRSAARTVATATSGVLNAVSNGNSLPIGPQMEYDMLTARFYLRVSAASGTGGLTLQLRGWDKASGLSVVIAADATPITAVGLYFYEVGPADVNTNARFTLNSFMPVQWDVNIAVGDATSYTYSLSMETTS